LLEPGTLDAAFVEEIERFKFRGSSGKVNLAVDRQPDFACLPGEGEHLRGAISFSPSVEEMEQAYDDAKYGRFSRRPYIDMIIPTPLDIERTTGLSEGNIFQGELSLEQLFFNRPVPGYARFRTPIRDLWLCGSATHPGGGIMGANGRIAALELLRSRGRRVA